MGLRDLMQPRLPIGLEPGLEAQGSPLRVLVVESSGYTAAALDDLAALTGLQVELARDPRVAVERLRNDFFDAVIIDLPTAYLTPEALFRDIVSIDLEQAVRVVFLVNDLGDPGTRKFLTDAGRPFLTQPVDPVELYDLVLRVAVEDSAD